MYASLSDQDKMALVQQVEEDQQQIQQLEEQIIKVTQSTDVNNSMRGLCKDDIVHLKSFAKPPVVVQAIVQAMITTLGYGEEYTTDYNKTKKILGDSNFLSTALSYDLHGISEENFLQTKRILRNIDEDTARNNSKSAYSAYKWVKGIHDYQSKSIQFILTQQQVKERLDRNMPLYEAIKEEQG